MNKTKRLFLTLVFYSIAGPVFGLNESRVETRTDEAMTDFGVTGKGVTIAVLDRGITWQHPDFVNPDGTSRIYKMLDMSGQTGCSANNPAPVEYTRQNINDALLNQTELGMRDAVGHGTATAGTAAGNGRALPDLRYMGIAPEADLVIVKLTSEGAPAHGDIPAEAAFNACYEDGIEWAAEVMDELGQPGALIINSGTQYGPMDGTSSVSRKLTEVFPEDQPGRIVVLPSGDEGSLPNHGRITFDASATQSIGLSRASTAATAFTAWYDGDVPAEVTLSFDDGTTLGPITPGQSLTQDDIQLIHYVPGTDGFRSTSGDHHVWGLISGHATTGTFSIKALNAQDGSATLDLYTDVSGVNLTPVTNLTDNLGPGRLQDWATTPSVISVADHNIRTSWVDIDGNNQSIQDEGEKDDLWLKSSGGPTRDGREPGIDLSAPGQNMFAPVGPDSWWATFRYALPQGSEGMYIRFGGTSGSSPIVLGAVALMLQVHPTMSTRQARQILRATTHQDSFTGNVPNRDWGYGKLDVYAAVEMALAESFSGPWYNAAQAGHGWFVEVLEGPDGSRRLNVYWYVYSDGKPAWILANGPLTGNTAVLDAFITDNGEFPPDFTGADVNPWGTMSFEFNTDGSATASWQTGYTGFSSGSMPITRLAGISGTQAGCRSGSFYNSSQSGHGFVMEVVEIGGVLNLLVAWYVYLDGKQVWLLGNAPFANDRADIPLQSFTGAQFPPMFSAGDVVSEPWGTLTVVFNGPDDATASWTTNRAGYSNGELDVIRLTSLAGNQCPD